MCRWPSGGRLRRPKRLAGDKGYSYRGVRKWLRDRRIQDVIAQRKDQVGRSDGNRDFDKPTYRRRNIIERVVGWLKESRRIATRFEKLAVCYLAMVTLGMILRLLGVF